MLTILTDADLHAPQPRGVCDVLLAGDRVVWIGTDRPDGLSALDVTTIACDGRPVVPGLVDAHVHVTGGGGEAGPTSALPAVPVEALTAAGVTTVVGLLGTDDVVRTPAQVHHRVRALRQHGLSAWLYVGGYALPAATITGDLATDLLHVDAVLGVGEVAVSDHRSSAPDGDDLVRLAATVRRAAMLAGKAGTVHLHLGDGPSGLDPVADAVRRSDVPPRLWHPTHVNRSTGLLAQAIELALDTGVRIDVTAFPEDGHDDAPTAAGAITTALDAGVPLRLLSCSSDAGGSLPVFGHDGTLLGLEVAGPDGLLAGVRALVAAGLPLSEALVPFTVAPAAQLGLDDVGRVRVGGRADLLVLEDVASCRVRDTVVAGRAHRRDGHVLVHELHTTGPLR